MKKPHNSLKSIYVTLLLLLMTNLAHATIILDDPEGDATLPGLDIAAVDFTYYGDTYTQTYYFHDDLNLADYTFWLDTSFSLYDEVNDYTRVITANYFNDQGKSTSYGSVHGFNTQYGTSQWSVGSNFITVEMTSWEKVSCSWCTYENYNIDPNSYTALSGALNVQNGNSWIFNVDNIKNATVSASVSEPATLTLFSSALLFLISVRSRRKH